MADQEAQLQQLVLVEQRPCRRPGGVRQEARLDELVRDLKHHRDPVGRARRRRPCQSVDLVGGESELAREMVVVHPLVLAAHLPGHPQDHLLLFARRQPAVTQELADEQRVDREHAAEPSEGTEDVVVLVVTRLATDVGEDTPVDMTDVLGRQRWHARLVVVHPGTGGKGRGRHGHRSRPPCLQHKYMP